VTKPQRVRKTWHIEFDIDVNAPKRFNTVDEVMAGVEIAVSEYVGYPENITAVEVTPL
jgi:hypothetical protein